jgi:hypothetical protein
MEAWVDAGVVNCEPLLLILKAEETVLSSQAPLIEVRAAYDKAIASCSYHFFLTMKL